MPRGILTSFLSRDRESHNQRLCPRKTKQLCESQNNRSSNKGEHEKIKIVNTRTGDQFLTLFLRNGLIILKFCRRSLGCRYRPAESDVAIQHRTFPSYTALLQQTISGINIEYRTLSDTDMSKYKPVEYSYKLEVCPTSNVFKCT